MTDREKIEALVDEELKEANEKYPLFHSPHEAYAVILEELEEVLENLEGVKVNLRSMWIATKADESIEDDADMLYRYSVALVQEGIQVAAMAKKVLMSELYKE